MQKRDINVFCTEPLKKGYVNILLLSYILANEKYPNETIAQLWQDLGLDLSHEPVLNTVINRTTTWFCILEQITQSSLAEKQQRLSLLHQNLIFMLRNELHDFMTIATFSIIIDRIKNDKPHELLSTYFENKTTEKFEKDQPNKCSYVKIKDLKSYLNEHLKISCPKQLTGKKPWSGDIFSKWKKFQNISNSKTMTIDQSVLAGSVPDKELFPELNIVYLQNIAKRWIKKYKKKDVDISRILLYPYASDFSPEKNPIKYALVFDISHYERKIVHNSIDTNKEFQDKFTIMNLMDLMNTLDSSYESFISDTGYMSTLHPSAIGFFYSSFSSVYIDTAPNDFKKEWIFIPAYKHYENTRKGLIRIEEGCAVLYDRSDKYGEQQKEKDQADNLSNQHPKKDVVKRVIKKEDDGWRIYFDGENERLDNPKAVKYISVALNNPGQKLTYSHLYRKQISHKMLIKIIIIWQ